MNNPKIGIVGLCSKVESGAQRYDDIINSAAKALKEAGVDVEVAKNPVYTSIEALRVCDQFKAAEIDAIAVIDVTWVCDSLSYIFVHELPVPAVFWAVPYTETFSIGCVQEFVSILKAENIHYEYVYGLADNKELIEKVRKVAVAGQMIKKLSHLRLALVGPRQTWRVAGPQDMTIEEWQFSDTLGPTITHMTIEDITDVAKTISDEEAEKVLDSLKDRTGKYLCSRDVMVWMAKVYIASKKAIDEGGLDGIAAECYPEYGGLMNQPSSWIEDEGYVLDTEGDIAHAWAKYALNMAAGGGCCALGEYGSYDDEKNYLCIAHEGSSPVSLAESIDKVQVSPENDDGCFVGFPLKPMKKCTVCDMQGVNGKYQMMIATGEVLPATHEEWVEGGEKLLVKLRIDGVKPSAAIDQMIEHGLHHHILVKEGDYAEQMKMVCRYMGIEVVELHA